MISVEQQMQSEPPLNLIAAARTIAELYDDMDRPEWFAAWLRRVARDFEAQAQDTHGNV